MNDKLAKWIARKLTPAQRRILKRGVHQLRHGPTAPAFALLDAGLMDRDGSINSKYQGQGIGGGSCFVSNDLGDEVAKYITDEQ